MSGQSSGELVLQSSEEHGQDGSVPRPPYSMDYVPYPETFGARVFSRLAEADAASAQSAGQIAALREDLRTVTEDVNMLRQENSDLRNELSEAQYRLEILQLRMEEAKLRTEINYEEIVRLKRDGVEQREGHEVLLGMVRANRLVAYQTDDRVETEHRRMDVLQRQVDEMRRQFTRSVSPSPASVDSGLRLPILEECRRMTSFGFWWITPALYSCGLLRYHWLQCNLANG